MVNTSEHKAKEHLWIKRYHFAWLSDRKQDNSWDNQYSSHILTTSYEYRVFKWKVESYKTAPMAPVGTLISHANRKRVNCRSDKYPFRHLHMRTLNIDPDDLCMLCMLACAVHYLTDTNIIGVQQLGSLTANMNILGDLTHRTGGHCSSPEKSQIFLWTICTK